MNKTKLLVIARDYSKFISHQHVYQLIEELARITDLVVYHDRGEDIQIILERLHIYPDFILILEYYETNTTRITGLKKLSIPYAIYMLDLHYDIELRTRLIEEENIRFVFASYREAFYNWYPGLINRFIWLPHHVNTHIFKDYGLPKTIDCLMMGAVSQEYYPLRYEIYNTMNTHPGFLYHPHPGYRNIEPNEPFFTGEKYAREINRAKIFFTCDSIFRYSLTKYFEAPACNSLLLASSLPELEELGFIPGVNYVDIDLNNFEEKALYYLQHSKERKAISAAGYEMVRENHSTARRARELLVKLEEIRLLGGRTSNS